MVGRRIDERDQAQLRDLGQASEFRGIDQGPHTRRQRDIDLLGNPYEALVRIEAVDFRDLTELHLRHASIGSDAHHASQQDRDQQVQSVVQCSGAEVHLQAGQGRHAARGDQSRAIKAR